MKITVLGAPGNMGTSVVEKLLEEDFVEKVSLLIHQKKGSKKLIKKVKKSKKEYLIIKGDISNPDDVKKIIEGSDYVINMAAVIPPASDKDPKAAIRANEIGPKVLTKAIEDIKENQPKLIHISTMGLYGDRNYKHPFGEVGDPLIISPFDIYTLTKLRGEFTVLESDVKCFAVIRQTALLYDDLMMKNVSDGLMFHTCFNSLLEWVTANDCAILIRNILKKDLDGQLNNDNFWMHCFNLAGGKENRVTGYDTLRLGFEIIGCSTEDFFDTNYNSLRNFHGEWFSDGYKLNDLFDYQHETIQEFWKHVLDTHKYFKLAKIMPKKLMKKIVIKRLLKDSNAPYYWMKHNDKARMFAYFNGENNFNAIPKDWKDFNLISKGKLPDGTDIDFEEYRTNVTRLNHFFDIDKDRSQIDIEDLRNVAAAHGGKLITDDFKTGDIFRKVEWEDLDGNRFFARPHTILFCGHWNNISYHEYAWDFDRLAKKDKIVAQIWYDAHDENENKYYWYDECFNSNYKVIE